MKLLIPVDTLAELADLNRLSNVIRTVDGDHTASAASIADGIADSGYITDLVNRVATQVQQAAALRAAEYLEDRGLTAMAEQVLEELGWPASADLVAV